MSAQLEQRLRTALRVMQISASAALAVMILAIGAAVVPTLLGYQSFAVYTGSMEPAIRVGDLAIVAAARPADLQVDDVVTYRLSSQPGVLITHRLIGIETDEQGQLLFQTKGDANEAVDNVAVHEGAVLGKVVFTMPKLGYLVQFARQSEGKLLLIVAPIVVMAADYLVKLRRRRGAAPMPQVAVRA